MLRLMRWTGRLGLAVAALICAGCAGAGESSPADVAKPARQLEPVAASAVPAAPAGARPLRTVLPPPPGRGPAYLVARIRRPLHTRYGTVPDRSQFGQPVWVPVVSHRTDRGRLLVPLGKSGRLVAADLASLPLQWRKVRVVIDLSASRMVVLDGRRRVGTFPIGKGSPSTPTPTGRFFVTDRLRFGQGSPYAPFAFGLSAHVSQLPSSWLGGNQVAIHYGAMGAVSHGCIHAGLDAIELLQRRVGLGTLVTIKP
jgi:L,D-transpeptidase catalytic domain